MAGADFIEAAKGPCGKVENNGQGRRARLPDVYPAGVDEARARSEYWEKQERIGLAAAPRACRGRVTGITVGSNTFEEWAQKSESF